MTTGTSAAVESLHGNAPGGSLRVAPFLIRAHYAQFMRGKFFFGGEYDRTPASAVVTIGPAMVPVPQDLRSWYVMGSYRLVKNVHVGSYYSHFVNKALDTSQPANYSKDWVVSGRYDFNAYFYGKIEGHFLHGTGFGYYASTNPDGLKPNSNMLAAKVGFSF